MKFAGKYGRTVTAENGDMEITLTVSGSNKFMAGRAVEYAKTLDRLTIDITEYRKARSLDANAYMWTLLNQLAYILKTTSIELYKKYVKECGVWTDYEMPERTAKAFEHIWKEKGIAWIVERLDTVGDMVTLRAYYGSSVYNTKQMSRLIDSIVTDCKEAGIETMSDKELKSLMGKWK